MVLKGFLILGIGCLWFVSLISNSRDFLLSISTALKEQKLGHAAVQIVAALFTVFLHFVGIYALYIWAI